MKLKRDLEPTRDHVPVIHDAYTPAFRAGGNADRQWELGVSASLHKGYVAFVLAIKPGPIP